jgi:hypothetical protein
MKHCVWLMLTVLLFACGQQPLLQLEPIAAVGLGINTSGTLTTSALLGATHARKREVPREVLFHEQEGALGSRVWSVLLLG